MAVLQQYKCPCCNGSIEFNSSSQKMRCPYCDTEFEPEALKSYAEALNEDADDEMKWEGQAGEAWRDGETEGLRVYTCSSCNGEIVGDETTGATFCPFCGSPVIMVGQFSGDLRPDYVIPFKLDKQAAIEALKKHCKGKKLLPKVFEDENHINKIQGIYVPFWLFDTDAEANIRYRATRIRHWSDSNYDYTETRYYAVNRAGNIGFAHVPVDGSEKMADDLMESIEPFNFSDAVDFQTAYLSGFFADKYDVDAEKSVSRANERIRKSTSDAFAATVHGYSSVVTEHTNIRLKNAQSKYALYPVWILNTTWDGKQYTFAMNGQTGKFVGDLPMDKSAYAKWLFGIAGVCGVVSMALSVLMWLL